LTFPFLLASFKLSQLEPKRIIREWILSITSFPWYPSFTGPLKVLALGRASDESLPQARKFFYLSVE